MLTVQPLFFVFFFVFFFFFFFYTKAGIATTGSIYVVGVCFWQLLSDIVKQDDIHSAHPCEECFILYFIKGDGILIKYVEWIPLSVSTHKYALQKGVFH